MGTENPFGKLVRAYCAFPFYNCLVCQEGLVSFQYISLSFRAIFFGVCSSHIVFLKMRLLKQIITLSILNLEEYDLVKAEAEENI